MEPVTQGNEQQEAQPPTMGEVISKLDSNSINEIIEVMKSKPNEVGSMLTKTMATMTPEQMNKARKVVTAGGSDELIKKMREQGIDPQLMKKDLMKKRDEAKKNGVSCVTISSSRKVKIVKLSTGTEYIDIARLLSGEEAPVKQECYGQISGKGIYVHYSSRPDRHNKKASTLIGFDVCGTVVFTKEHGDKIVDMKLEDLGITSA